MGERVAIYCRLSEEDRNKQSGMADSESIQNQKAMLADYARRQGWEISRIYSDDDYAGADRKRPEFNLLLEDARQRRFDIVLCKTQSRFTRELELVETYIHGLFPLWGIRFISIVDHADTANQGNKKSRQINGLVNEWYLEDMSENIKSVLANKRQNGFHIGSFALYGYQKDPNQKGRLIIDEEAAAVVREVFTLFSQGYGKTAIARILNARGIPNPTEYKRLKGLRYQQPRGAGGKLWKYSAIAAMLQNEIYIGNMVQGKYGSVSYKTKQNRPRPKEAWYRVEGTHEPVIEKELWEQVQKLLNQHAKPFTTGTVGIFARKARCANCGYCMRSSKTRDRYYLKCPTRQVAAGACAGSFIAVEALEQAVIGELRCLSETCLDSERLRQHVRARSHPQNQMEMLSSHIEECQKKISDCSKGIRELYLDKVRGILPERDYVELLDTFSRERDCLESMVFKDQNQLALLGRAMREDRQEAAIDQYLETEHLDREMVEMMITSVSVGSRVPETGEIPVEIHWNF